MSGLTACGNNDPEQIQSVFEAQQHALAEAATRVQGSEVSQRLQSVFTEQQKAVTETAHRFQATLTGRASDRQTMKRKPKKR